MGLDVAGLAFLHRGKKKFKVFETKGIGQVLRGDKQLDG
jgi:hypothetical protein